MQSVYKVFATFIFFVLLLLANVAETKAQCPMCKTSVESSIKNGGDKGKGLNNGIMYLLAMPYFAVGGVGILWYLKYRKKNVTINIPDEKLNLN